MPQSSPLGDYIRRQRELYGMSMRQFAELAGISNPYLSQIERGLREPSEKVVDAIARSLETTADALYEQAGVSFDEDDASENGVLAAIDADPALTPRQRRVMRDVYEAFLATTGAPPRRRRKPRAS